MPKLYRDFETRARIDAEYDVERSVPDFMDYGRQYGLPRTVVKSGIPISGLFDLEPLRHSFLQDDLRLDDGLVARNSPQFLIGDAQVHRAADSRFSSSHRPAEPPAPDARPNSGFLVGFISLRGG